jgi:hypothetical protein
MTHRTILFASLMLVAGAHCDAQSPAASSATSASSATTAPSAPAAADAGTDSAVTGSESAATNTPSSEPSPELVKEARREGFRPKKRDGVTLFCHTDATLGTRFETEKCVNQAQLQTVVQQREDQRNVMRQQGACTGSNCSGH